MPQTPKAVLFDMDGVLINSMPMHVDAWTKLYNKYDISVSEEYLYGEEGRVGTAAITKLFKEQKGQELSQEERKSIYSQKTDDVKTRPTPPPVDDMIDFVKLIKQTCATSIVTGSGQPTLMATLDKYYPGCFDADKMVSAKDVSKGKPDPEPYLMGCQKHGIKPEEAMVIENAPLGIQSGKAAGIFVAVINIGKLTNEHLYECGADVVFNSAKEMIDWWRKEVV